MAEILQRCVRRVIAFALAYALALQGFAFAIASASPAAASAQSPTFIASPLCVHGRTTTLPGAPSRVPLGDNHCPFCIGGTVYVNCALPRAGQCNFTFVSTAWLLVAPHFIPRLVGGGAWPRGPPAAA
jgi:hypothetical protein